MKDTASGDVFKGESLCRAGGGGGSTCRGPAAHAGAAAPPAGHWRRGTPAPLNPAPSPRPPPRALPAVPVSETHPSDPSHMLDNDDIAQMNNMHEGPLLALLHRRYTVDGIYTFTGDILISINPYKGIPGLYTIPEEDYGGEGAGRRVGWGAPAACRTAAYRTATHALPRHPAAAAPPPPPARPQRRRCRTCTVWRRRRTA